MHEMKSLLDAAVFSFVETCIFTNRIGGVATRREYLACRPIVTSDLGGLEITFS